MRILDTLRPADDRRASGKLIAAAGLDRAAGGAPDDLLGAACGGTVERPELGAVELASVAHVAFCHTALGHATTPRESPMRKIMIAVCVALALTAPVRAQAATFSDFGTIANDQAFQSRVTYAMVQAAIAIYNESAGTAGHAARANFARQVLSTGYNLREVAMAVLATTTVAAEANAQNAPGYSIPDTDIANAVSAIWNALAGA